MRNLIPLVVSRLETAAEIPLPLQKVAVDQDLVFCCFVSPDTDTVALHSWSPQAGWSAQIEWPLPEPRSTVIGLKGDSLDNSAVVIMSNGDVVTASLADGMATIVGSLETPVVACEWSPDGEVLCLVLATGRVLFLSASFEELKNHALSATDLDLANKHVTVGWGKRETQFQGRGAKRDPTLLEKIETRETSLSDNHHAYISWRGDGDYVVVNAIDPESHKRALRVFTRAGELSSVSEPADHILGYVAWQPMGALIACVKHSPTEPSGTVQFFERNGLRRRSFEISDAQDVTSLAWSSDSAILSVSYRSRIDLWTVKNYHWYRKQSIPTPRHNLELGLEPMWHQERSGTLIVPSQSEIKFYTYRFAYASDEGLAAVIDSNEVKVTPLAYMNMPPPMAFASLELDSQPSAVAVKAPDTVAVATIDCVKVYRLDLEEEELVLLESYDLPDVRFLSFGSDHLIAYTNSDALIDLFDGEASPSVIQPASPITVLSGDHYLSNSRLYSLETGGLVADFGEPCMDFIIKSGTANNSYGLTRSEKLVHGSSQAVLQHGVTSMVATSRHLLFTTMTQLKFIHLVDSGELPTLPGDNDVKSEQNREVERGSLLVSVIPSAMTTVLQAPRGNIETIYPRMLVLGSVRQSVAAGDYLKAFQTCKVHRIDMNLLYDLDPAQFTSQIPQVTKALGSDVQVDLLLSAFSDEDVTRSKYVDTSSMKATVTDAITTTDAASSAVKEGKANSVLDAMLPHLSPQSRITALALKRPPQLADALFAAAKDVRLVKHLCFLSDAEELYKTALGVYDPTLALAVAQQAQMDPKEYLPFLRARQSENTYRRRFNIDLYLRHYDKALASLVSDETASEDELVEFVDRHGLHSEALAVLQGSDRPARSRILESQAEIWYTAARYTDAGRNFEVLGQLERAAEAYVLAGDWRKALSLSGKDEGKRRETASKLAEALEAEKRFVDAAHLFAYYLDDPVQAIECYCRANLYDDAILIGHMHGLGGKLEDGLRESYASFQELLADCARQVPAQARRLRELRVKRDEDALGFEHQMADLDVADNLSVAGTETTNASIFTRYTDKSSVGTAATNATRRTAKNQRRQERKRAMGKKGSVFEEEYLISSTGRLVDRLVETRTDIQGLVVALQRCKLPVYADQLVSEYDKVLQLLRETIDEVYTVDDRALVRYDASGHEYLASRPVQPALPSGIHF